MVARLILAIIIAVSVVAGSSTYAAVDPGNLCKEAKDKAAGKKAFDLLKAFGKNTKKRDDGKLGQDISKVQSKFTKAFSKADDTGGDACPFLGDAADVELAVDDAVAEILSLTSVGPPTTSTTTTTTSTLALCGNGVVDGGEQCDQPDYGGATCGSLRFNKGGTLGCTAACQYDVSGCACQALPATGQTTSYQAVRNDGNPVPVDVPDDGAVQAGATVSYVDNGDGTITDLNTGLMWEKKSDDGGLHDKDNQYAWSCLNNCADSIWDWLEDVNTEGGAGFAGYSDWRIPNVRELHSVLDYGRAEPAVDPVFYNGCADGCAVTSCSCLRGGGPAIWTSTFNAAEAYTTPSAWQVEFERGQVGWRDIDDAGRPLAVRGGLSSSPSGAFLDLTTAVLD